MEGTENKKGRWERFRENSRQDYQLVVRHNQNLTEVGTYNLTPMNLYIVGSTVVFLVAILVYLLVAYTPLRKYIPGYGDVVLRQEMNDMENIVEELTEAVATQNVYINNLKNTLYGEVTTGEDIEEQTVMVDTSELEPVALSEEEVRLRREMSLERVGQASRGATTTESGSNLPLEQLFFAPPVNGEISAGFRPSEKHYGVDVLAALNTAIKAAYEGTVFMSEFTSDNGNVLGIMHDNNVITFYKHNSKLLKKVGDRVRQGEAVAIIGNTGEQTTGPHLHFELWYRGAAVDPMSYVGF